MGRILTVSSIQFRKNIKNRVYKICRCIRYEVREREVSRMTLRNFAWAKQNAIYFRRKSKFGVSSWFNLDNHMIAPRTLNLKQVTQRNITSHSSQWQWQSWTRLLLATAVLSDAQIPGVPLTWPSIQVWFSSFSLILSALCSLQWLPNEFHPV